MLSETIPLTSVGNYGNLVADYLAENKVLSEFITAFPSIDALLAQTKLKAARPVNRSLLVKRLEEQNAGIALSDSTRSNLQAIAAENTFTITTGHQLCLYTGPAYFIYKIVSTIQLANQLQQKNKDMCFVPVFWMASEDHDAEEINHAFVREEKLQWQVKAGGAVGEFSTAGLAELNEKFIEMIGSPAGIGEWIREAYDGKNSLSKATRILVNHLFGKYGLVVVDGDDLELKKSFKEVIEEEMLLMTSENPVRFVTERLAQLGYKETVHPRPINMFLLGKESRNRWEKVGDNWVARGDHRNFSEKEVRDMIQKTPEAFSPNVVLRPLYQEWILPNIAYIGGPGEIAYWCQLKKLFDHYSVPFPILLLRDSAFVLSQKISSRLAKLGLTMDRMLTGKDHVIKELMREHVPDLSAEKEELRTAFEKIIAKARAVDPTLTAYASAEMQRQLSSVEGIEKKILRSAKQSEAVKLNQVDKLFDQLFPGGEWQERHANGLALIADFGLDWMDELVATFNPLSKELKVFTSGIPGTSAE